MLKGAFTSPKIRTLAARLGVPFPQALGMCGLLWNFTADHAPQGDVGKHDDLQIAMALEWPGEPAALVAAFIACRLLDEDPKHRLLVHDWPEHCPRYVRATLDRKGLDLIESTAVATTVRTTVATAVRTTVDPPLPLPLPLPPPLPPPPPPPVKEGTATNRGKPRSPPAVAWSPEHGWSIDEAVQKRWVDAYPAVDVTAALARASAWLAANPNQRPKRLFEMWMNRWLARDQDRAASRSAASAQHAAKPPRKGW